MKPVFKWAGGKRRIADKILPLLQLDKARGYVEPFVGGGAIYCAVQDAGFAGPALLNDVSPYVACAWRAIQDEPTRLLALFREYAIRDSREFYFEHRWPPPEGEVEKAAWFLYLNRAGFNGLWRLNKSGRYNVPYGDGKPPVLDEDNLRAVSAALQNAWIREADFAELRCGRGDTVYCDPPFLPLSKTANFSSYTRGGYKPSDQVRLAHWCRAQADEGARVVLSNAGVEDSLAAFHELADETHEIKAPRVISCKGAKRKPVGEYLFAFGGAL